MTPTTQPNQYRHEIDEEQVRRLATRTQRQKAERDVEPEPLPQYSLRLRENGGCYTVTGPLTAVYQALAATRTLDR